MRQHYSTTLQLPPSYFLSLVSDLTVCIPMRTHRRCCPGCWWPRASRSGRSAGRWRR